MVEETVANITGTINVSGSGTFSKTTSWPAALFLVRCSECKNRIVFSVPSSTLVNFRILSVFSPCGSIDKGYHYDQVLVYKDLMIKSPCCDADVVYLDRWKDVHRPDIKYDPIMGLWAKEAE